MRNPITREAFRFDLYTGMRRAEVFGLEWARVDMEARVLRIEETKAGEPLEFPITRQLAAILERRFAEREGERFPERSRGWVFPSANAKSKAGHIDGMQHMNARIGRGAGRSSGSTRCATASSPSPTAT